MRRQTMAVFKIHEKDNVAVAVTPVSKGETVTVGNTTLTVLDDIPAGHKLAVVPIAKGQDVVKYGFPIGTAKEDIPAGPGFTRTTYRASSATCSITPTSRKKPTAGN